MIRASLRDGKRTRDIGTVCRAVPKPGREKGSEPEYVSYSFIPARMLSHPKSRIISTQKSADLHAQFSEEHPIPFG